MKHEIRWSSSKRSAFAAAIERVAKAHDGKADVLRCSSARAFARRVSSGEVNFDFDEFNVQRDDEEAAHRRSLAARPRPWLGRRLAMEEANIHLSTASLHEAIGKVIREFIDAP